MCIKKQTNLNYSLQVGEGWAVHLYLIFTDHSDCLLLLKFSVTVGKLGLKNKLTMKLIKKKFSRVYSTKINIWFSKKFL